MKSRSEIWVQALEELGAQCSVDTARDATTVERRAAQEGDSFFKVTLPQFAKDLEKSLATGFIPADAFTGWSRRNRTVYIVSNTASVDCDARSANEPDLFQVKVNSGIPRFLGGFMELVFVDDRVISKSTWDDSIEWLLHEAADRKMSNQVKQTVADLLPPVLSDLVSDGIEGLRPRFITPNEEKEIDTAAGAIHAIRQLCLMFSKEKELPAQRDIDNEIARFVEIDEELEGSLMQSELPGIDAFPSSGKSREMVERLLSVYPEIHVTSDRWFDGDMSLPGPDRHDGTYSSQQWAKMGDIVHQGSMTSEQYKAWMSLQGHDNDW